MRSFSRFFFQEILSFDFKHAGSILKALAGFNRFSWDPSVIPAHLEGFLCKWLCSDSNIFLRDSIPWFLRKLVDLAIFLMNGTCIHLRRIFFFSFCCSRKSGFPLFCSCISRFKMFRMKSFLFFSFSETSMDFFCCPFPLETWRGCFEIVIEVGRGWCFQEILAVPRDSALIRLNKLLSLWIRYIRKP